MHHQYLKANCKASALLFHFLPTLCCLPHHSFSLPASGSLEKLKAVRMEQRLSVLKRQSKWLSSTSIIKSHKNLSVERAAGAATVGITCGQSCEGRDALGMEQGVRRRRGAQGWDVAHLRCEEWQSSAERRGGLWLPCSG